MAANKHNRIIAIVCFVLFVLSFIAFNPGFLTPDGLDQYKQALSGEYTDWHPPLMAFTWRMLNHIHNGPEVMLVMQLVLLWGSVYLLATAVKSRLWYVFMVLFALAPFILNFAGNIFKDMQMAFAWLMAFSLLFNRIVRHVKVSKLVAAITLLLILYGTWIRPNALPGAAALLLLWAWVMTAQQSRRVFIIVSLLLIVFTVAGTFLFTGRIFNAKKQYAENKIFMHDLAGIFVKTGDNVFPAMMYDKPQFDTGYIRANYLPATFDFMWWNNDGKNVRPHQADRASNKLKAAWKKAVLKYPTVYLSNRWDGFLYFLRIKKRTDEFGYSSPWVIQNEYGFVAKGRGFHEAVFAHVDMHKNMPYMRPWFWFFLNIILAGFIPLVKRKETRVLYTALVLSSLVYVLPQFFIFQIDTEFRYMYWNCIACTIALFIFIQSKLGKQAIL